MIGVLCRSLNRVFASPITRRLISTPTVDSQIDPDAFHRRRRRAGLDFLDEFFGHGRIADQRVLDLGCGLGARTAAVARASAALAVGIDNDPTKIDRARKAADEMGCSGLRFSVTNGSELCFGDDTFDVVLLLEVIEHVADPAAVLDECARVVRPGGRILVTFPPYRSPWGGHLFVHVPIPWAQLVFPDREVLDLWREIHAAAVDRGEVECSAKRARAIMSADKTADLWDCNEMTIASFLDFVDRAPLQLEAIRLKTLGGLGGWVTRRPGLREYLVTRVTAVLAA